MIRAEHTTVNSSILGGVRFLLIIGVGFFLLFQFGPFSEKKAADVDVAANSYPFIVPKMLKDGYIGENPQILNALSVWEFRMRNNGSKELTNVMFQLPFSGYYNMQGANTESQIGVATFSRLIKLDQLNPGQYVVLTIWAGDELSGEFERKIRVASDAGVLSVEYPVMASGLVAWVERYKTPLSLSLFILFIATVL